MVFASIMLIFSSCVLLLQADAHRGRVLTLRRSKNKRYLARLIAVFILIACLTMISALNGWELGIPIWLGLLSVASVASLFLNAQAPVWHAPTGGLAGVFGALLGLWAVAF